MSMIGYYHMVDEPTLKKLQTGAVSPESVIFAQDLEGDDALCIDKAWHGVYTVLEAMDADRGLLTRAVLGATPINDEDFAGYGPLIHSDSGQVRQIDEALRAVTEEAFKSHYDFDEMRAQGVYPIVEADLADEFYDYLWQNFLGVQEFFHRAAEKGCCVLFYLG